MKKILQTSLIAFLICIGLSSCSIHETEPDYSGLANIRVYFQTVPRWTLSENGNYFFSDMYCPDLTYNVFRNGTVNVYLILNAGKPNEIYVPLPYDIYYNETDQFGNLIQWTETISFDLAVNSVRFYYEPSDFYTGLTPPASVFKIVIMW